MTHRRFVTWVYCAFSMLAAGASTVMAHWGVALGMTEESVGTVSHGLAAVAVFNLVALSAVELLHRYLNPAEH